MTAGSTAMGSGVAVGTAVGSGIGVGIGAGDGVATTISAVGAAKAATDSVESELRLENISAAPASAKTPIAAAINCGCDHGEQSPDGHRGDCLTVGSRTPNETTWSGLVWGTPCGVPQPVNELAATQGVADLGKQCLIGRWSRIGLGASTSQAPDDHEHNKCDQHEGDQRSNECAEWDLAGLPIVEVDVKAASLADQRHDDVDDGVHNRNRGKCEHETDSGRNDIELLEESSEFTEHSLWNPNN